MKRRSTVGRGSGKVAKKGTAARKRIAAPEAVVAAVDGVDDTHDLIPTPTLLGAANHKLPDALARPAIIRDFAKESPHPSSWPDWIDSKAYVYGVDRGKVERWLVKHMEGFDQEVQSASWAQAQSVAKALGATRAAVINTAAQMLVATRALPVKQKKGEEDRIVIPVEVPDWDVRKFAVGFFERMYGMAMPAKVEHQHDIGDNLMAVSEAELVVRLAELQAKLSIGGGSGGMGVDNRAKVIEGSAEVVRG